LLIAEPGSDAARLHWRSATRRVASVAAYPEVRAAVAAARRARRISRQQSAVGRRDLDRLWEEVDQLDLTMIVARRAGELAEQHGLRGYDAVHLASAEAVADTETVFVAADTRLLGAAGALGVMVAPL
jgi:uncharacterized protein